MVSNSVKRLSVRYLKQVEILKEYNNSKNSNELCEILNIKSRRLSTIRAKSGIKSPYLEKGSRIKHQPKQAIPDFDLGWCLGFFAADGTLYQNRSNRSPINRIEVTLAIKDKKCLFNFFNTLLYDIAESNFRIRPPTLGTTNKINYVASMPFFENIIRSFLIFKHKTYDLSVNRVTFNKSSEEFKIGFLRGIIDGDGWVDKNGRRISIVSASQTFITDLQFLFGGTISKRKGEYWNLSFKKNEVEQLLMQGINNYPHITLTRKDERLNKHIWNTQQNKKL